MQNKKARKIWKWIKIVLAIYIVIGIAAYFLQEKLLFRGEKLAPDHSFQFTSPFREINLEVNNAKNLSIVQFTVPDSVRKGVVLYFHGNQQNIERYAPFAPNFTRNNYEVWMMDYPGYGKSTGNLTEKIIYDDAKQLYKMARSKFSKDSIIIYGRSLGTGVATYLASVKDCKRLILESPYYSIDALMQNYLFIYPVRLMSKYHFPNWRYIQQVNAPVTIFHSTNDEVIAFRHSKRLLKYAKPGTELVTLEKVKHNQVNDSPLFQQKLDSVLQLR